MTASLEVQNSKRPYMFKCFEASTIHISKNDDQKLKNASENVAGDPLGVYTYDYGYFIYTGMGDFQEGDFELILKAGYSQALVNLMRLAIKSDCKFLCLDADGMIYEDLEKFDW